MSRRVPPGATTRREDGAGVRPELRYAQALAERIGLRAELDWDGIEDRALAAPADDQSGRAVVRAIVVAELAAACASGGDDLIQTLVAPLRAQPVRKRWRQRSLGELLDAAAWELVISANYDELFYWRSSEWLAALRRAAGLDRAVARSSVGTGGVPVYS